MLHPLVLYGRLDRGSGKVVSAVSTLSISGIVLGTKLIMHLLTSELDAHFWSETSHAMPGTQQAPV